MPIVRREFQLLAADRLADALSLLAFQRFGAAYYLAGLAVECALKACIARQIQAESIPDQELVNGVYSHNLKALLTLAGLQSALDSRQATDLQFGNAWAIVCQWKIEARYNVSVTSAVALQYVDAVNNSTYGVFPWLTSHW